MQLKMCQPKRKAFVHFPRLTLLLVSAFTLADELNHQKFRCCAYKFGSSCTCHLDFASFSLSNPNCKCVRQMNGDLLGKYEVLLKKKRSDDCTRASVATRSSGVVDTGSREDSVMGIPAPLSMNPSDLTSSGKMVSQFFNKSDVLQPKIPWT